MSEPRGQRATLHLFRFCLAIAVMVVLGTWLASTLQRQQGLAQEVNWQAQTRQLALQVQWLHGRWLNERHADVLVIPARAGGQTTAVQMSATGWPQPARPWSDAGCLQLWQQLLEVKNAPASTLPVAIYLQGEGCEFHQSAATIRYHWLEGTLAP